MIQNKTLESGGRGYPIQVPMHFSCMILAINACPVHQPTATELCVAGGNNNSRPKKKQGELTKKGTEHTLIQEQACACSIFAITENCASSVYSIRLFHTHNIHSTIPISFSPSLFNNTHTP